jgi:hypothetical protein
MSETVNEVYGAIDSGLGRESAATRRKFVAGAAATIGGAGLLSLPGKALAANDAATILNIAATAEVLATIVNTVGAERVSLDQVTKRNVLDAAYQELDHYKVLVSIGAKPATKSIWVPDAVFAGKDGLLSALVAGDGIFVNAYLIGVTAFAKAGKDTYARYAAEFMGIESVHRALALQSLGKPGNDLAFAGPYTFSKIEGAVSALQSGGFGFGARGSKPGAFYEFDSVSKRTKVRHEVHQLSPK